MPSALFNLDLIHALHALHKRIDALEQVTQMHARVQHDIPRLDVYSLRGILKRIKYLENEIRVLRRLGRATGNPNTRAIEECQRKLTQLIEERRKRMYPHAYSNLSAHAHTGIIKVAINEKHTGFRVSPEGIRLYESLSGKPFPDHAFHKSYEFRYRTDPYLIQVIETLKDRASAPGAKLVIKQIPSDIDWHIHFYDGYESIYKTVDGTDYELMSNGSWRDTSEDDSNDEL